MKKVLFLRLAPWMEVAYPHPQDIPYAFDVAQSAAFLDAREHRVVFLDGFIERLSVESALERVVSFGPDILALTATSSVRAPAAEIFRRIKTLLPKAYLIGFGQHAHYSPQTFLNESLQIDACVYGEAELTLAELVQEMPQTAAQKRDIKGIYYWDGQLKKAPERPLTDDLDLWPMPRYEIFKGGDYRIVSINFPAFRRIRSGWILAGRGCPYQCTVCSPAIRRSFGTSFRAQSPVRVADTFDFLAKGLGVNTIYFGDDTFSLDTGWVDKVCDELISRNNHIQWGMTTRADRLSPGLIRKMKAAGLRAAALGLESGSKRVLEQINKGVSHEEIAWAIAELERHNISVNVTAIVGHINETIGELNQTFSFIKKTRPFFVQLHYLSPYPGAKIAEAFEDRLGNDIAEISHFNASPINLSNIPDDILAGAIQKFYLRYYASWGFIRKYFKHRLRYTVCNPLKEAKLIKDSLGYFLFSAKNKACGRKSKQAKIKKLFLPRQTISIGWLEIFKSLWGFVFKSSGDRDCLRWEKKFAELVGVPYAASFISERAGTYFTLKALQEMNNWEKPEIICPAYTFFSVPWAAKFAGWQVRLADVLKEDLTLDPQSLERQINERTKAVIVTHLNGNPARMPEIAEICRKHNLRILEDCAHATGLEIDGKPAGSWDIGCFSFGDGKNLGTFGGGMITACDRELIEALKKMSSGFAEQPKAKLMKKILDTFLLKIMTTRIFYPLLLYPLLRWFGYLSADNRKKDFSGFCASTTEKDLTFKFSGLQARVGLSQLNGLDKRNEIRRANSRAFRSCLPEGILRKMLPWDGTSPHTMLHDAIILDREADIARKSLRRGIDIRLDYCGNCRNFPGMENFPGEDRVGKGMDGRVFFVPNHPGMDEISARNAAVILKRLLINPYAEINANISVRRAAKADTEGIIKIVTASFSSEENHRILGERATAAILKMLFKSEDSVVLIAEEEKQILGYLWFQLKSISLLGCFKNAPWETLGVISAILRESKFKTALKILKGQPGQMSAPYPKIASLAVDEQFRKKGIASALLEAAERYLEDGRITDIFVLTAAINLSAISFYEKNGFEKLENSDSSVVLGKKIKNGEKTNERNPCLISA